MYKILVEKNLSDIKTERFRSVRSSSEFDDPDDDLIDRKRSVLISLTFLLPDYFYINSPNIVLIFRLTSSLAKIDWRSTLYWRANWFGVVLRCAKTWTGKEPFPSTCGTRDPPAALYLMHWSPTRIPSRVELVQVFTPLNRVRHIVRTKTNSTWSLNLRRT